MMGLLAAPRRLAVESILNPVASDGTRRGCFRRKWNRKQFPRVLTWQTGSSIAISRQERYYLAEDLAV